MRPLRPRLRGSVTRLQLTHSNWYLEVGQNVLLLFVSGADNFKTHVPGSRGKISCSKEAPVHAQREEQ